MYFYNNGMLSCREKKTSEGKLLSLFSTVKTIWITFSQYTMIQNAHALKEKKILHKIKDIFSELKWLGIYLHISILISCNVQSRGERCLWPAPPACVSWSVYTVCSFKAGSLAHTGTVSDWRGLQLRATHTHTHTHRQFYTSQIQTRPQSTFFDGAPGQPVCHHSQGHLRVLFPHTINDMKHSYVQSIPTLNQCTHTHVGDSMSFGCHSSWQ